LLQVDYDGRLVEYEFGELDEVQLAYATSIHKSQGSEYPAVVIPLAMQHYTLLGEEPDLHSSYPWKEAGCYRRATESVGDGSEEP
jgi:hypothetical protein